VGKMGDGRRAEQRPGMAPVAVSADLTGARARQDYRKTGMPAYPAGDDSTL
jgi:hypothetical protein